MNPGSSSPNPGWPAAGPRGNPVKGSLIDRVNVRRLLYQGGRSPYVWGLVDVLAQPVGPSRQVVVDVGPGDNN